MRVYYNSVKASIVVGAAKVVYPAGSLEARVDGDVISIWPPDNVAPVFSGHFSSIQDEIGQTFSTAAAALAYVRAEFAKTPYTNTNDYDPGDLAAYWSSL